MKKSINALFTVFIVGLVLSLPTLTWAHGYWLEVKGSGKVGESAQIQLFYGEYSEHVREKGARLDKMSEIKISVIDAQGTKTEVEMQQTDTYWQGSFVPKIEGIYQVLGINETREVQDWTKHNLGITRPVQYLRTTYVVGNAAKTPLLPQNYLDVTAQKLGNQILLEVYKDKQAFSKMQLKVINPDGWEKNRTTNDKGKVAFIPAGKGLYLVELEWMDKTPGTFKGKEYESVRHRCDMTLVVE